MDDPTKTPQAAAGFGLSPNDGRELSSELLARLRAADPQAWNAFLQSRHQALLRFVERNLGEGLRRKVEPTDIVQEVGLSVAGSLESLDLGDRDPFGWLCQLAERRIIDAHRRHFGAQKRSATREVGLEVGGTQSENSGGGLINVLIETMTSPSEAMARDQRAVRLHQALEKLPAEAREAIRLRYVEGLPSKEIAAQLGKTDGATRVLLTRALAKLQELLGEETLFGSFQSKRPSE